MKYNSNGINYAALVQSESSNINCWVYNWWKITAFLDLILVFFCEYRSCELSQLQNRRNDRTKNVSWLYSIVFFLCKRIFIVGGKITYHIVLVLSGTTVGSFLWYHLTRSKHLWDVDWLTCVLVDCEQAHLWATSIEAAWTSRRNWSSGFDARDPKARLLAGYRSVTVRSDKDASKARIGILNLAKLITLNNLFS